MGGTISRGHGIGRARVRLDGCARWGCGVYAFAGTVVDIDMVPLFSTQGGSSELEAVASGDGLEGMVSGVR